MAGRSPAATGRSAVLNVQRVRELWMQLGLSQDDLARTADVSKRTVENVECGQGVNAKTFKAIAGPLRVEPAELCRPSDATTTVAPPTAGVPVPQTLTVGRFVDNFQGRDTELAAIMADLRAGRLVNIHAVKAQGGMGKTTLAEKVAADVADLFPTALKLSLNGTTPQPTPPVQALTDVIRRFRPDLGQLPDTPAELRPLYL